MFALLFVTSIVVSMMSMAQAIGFSVSKAIILGRAGVYTEGAAIEKMSTGHIVVGGYVSIPIGGQTPLGGYDFLLQKYDSSMNLVWTRFAGGTDTDSLGDIAVDINDNIYAVGGCRGAVDGIPATSDYNWCIFKFDTNGNKLWTKLYSSSSPDHDFANGVAVDNTGTYLYVVGYAGGYFAQSVIVSGTKSSVLMKLDTATGTAQKIVRVNNRGDNVAMGVAVDSNNNSYVVGKFNSAHPDGYNGIPSFGRQDATISKFDSSGNALWHRTFGDINWDGFNKVVVDSSNNVYAVGFATKAGNYSGIVQGYTSSGDLIFSQDIGGTSDDECIDVALDSVNNMLYITGYTYSVFYGNKNVNNQLNSYGSTFIVLVSTIDGSIQYSNIYNSTYPGSDMGNAITLSSGTPYITGRTTGGYNGVLSAGGKPDMSILMLEAAPTISPTQAPSTISPSQSPTFASTNVPIVKASTDSVFLNGSPLILFSVAMMILFLIIVALLVWFCFMKALVYGSRKEPSSKESYHTVPVAFAKADAEAPPEANDDNSNDHPNISSEPKAENMEFELTVL